MKFVVENICQWIAPEQQVDELSHYNNGALDLSWVPAMQRRRLSPYMKMVLHCLHQSGAGQEQIAINFSSRHGDLHKTATLLQSIVVQEPLSPTAFGLSVHNAALGLFSIISKNLAPMNAVAGGDESIVSALIDGYARLQIKPDSKLVICHADRALPSEYQEFANELQVDHAIAFQIRLPKVNEPYYSLKQREHEVDNSVQTRLPLSLQFAQGLELELMNSMQLNTNKRSWILSYHA